MAQNPISRDQGFIRTRSIEYALELARLQTQHNGENWSCQRLIDGATSIEAYLNGQ